MMPRLEEADWGPEPVADEPARLAALHRLEVLDTPRDDTLDRLTRWATEHFRVPVALVSLVDADRQWFKSACNFDTPETSREVAFCNHTIRSSHPMVVEDALMDPRFRDNPLVTENPYIRFYAGAPIITPEGYGIGTVCLLDWTPRSFPITDQFTLRQLAVLVLDELQQHQP